MTLRTALVLLLLTVPLAAQSPYLAEHASNLVHWSPWGAEAFARAKREGKPIFLSIGYASCHWCHVMSRESFDDADVAKVINESFVAILVDREEHPDVDATYLSYLQTTTGSAGWPANLILTPELQPLIGGSYMRPDALQRLLAAVADRWLHDRSSLLASVDMLRGLMEQSSPAEVAAKETVARAIEELRAQDHSSGPRFPQPSRIDVLLRSGDELALRTLREMAGAPIHDAIGGGFHRYAVDAAWQEPHFEKMLTDQALLAIDYLEAWQITHDPRFAEVARDTLDFMLELRLPNGGFGSGLSADSGPKQEEGAFYFWRRNQLSFLGKDAEAAAHSYHISETDSLPWRAYASSAQSVIRKKMKQQRDKRPKPRLDAKVITSWNALAISALARAGAALGEPRYIEAAKKTARLFPLRALEHTTNVAALNEDYACLIAATIDLFEATGDVAYLESALALQKQQDERFWNGSRYDNGSTLPKDLAALAVESESALPTSNSISTINLLRLGELTDADAMRDRARTVIRSYGSRLQSAPSELPAMVAALTMTLGAPRQIVIAGDPARSDMRRMWRIAHEHFLPFRVIVRASPAVAKYLPLVKSMKPIRGKATAYVCEHYMCKLPISNPSELRGALEKP